jgi:hypothetical protein
VLVDVVRVSGNPTVSDSQLFTEISFGLTYRDSRRPVAAGEWPASAGGR